MYLDDPHLQPPRPRGPFPSPQKAQTRHAIARARYLETQTRNRDRRHRAPAVWWTETGVPATATRIAMAGWMTRLWARARIRMSR